ncbi:MAG TPA: hypothetical protein P5560_09350 [Thermotogota bacterium]|nr:hypothetical protein [Thermotogota bacterium]HRW93138.1 hypothetical protein [Thermotogota bacterium]
MADVNAVLAYLSVIKERDDKYIGGILATDGYGIPLEFKYSEPLKPTGLQKILYGNSIEKFLVVDTIGKRLLLNLQEKPRIILAGDIRLLELQTKFSMVHLIPKTSETQQQQGDIDSHAFSDDEMGAFRVISHSPLTADEFQLLEKVSREMDVMEPFSRLKEALQYVCSDQ